MKMKILTTTATAIVMLMPIMASSQQIAPATMSGILVAQPITPKPPAATVPSPVMIPITVSYSEVVRALHACVQHFYAHPTPQETVGTNGTVIPAPNIASKAYYTIPDCETLQEALSATTAAPPAPMVAEDEKAMIHAVAQKLTGVISKGK